MTSKFFLTLIYFWISNPKSEMACREAIEFYYWLERLKACAFLPGVNHVSIEHRQNQIRKCLKKMPTLTGIFFTQLNSLESDRPKNFPQSDLEFLSLKRNKVGSLIDFLNNITTEHHIEILRSMLVDTPGPSPFFKLKRNRKK